MGRRRKKRIKGLRTHQTLPSPRPASDSACVLYSCLLCVQIQSMLSLYHVHVVPLPKNRTRSINLWEIQIRTITDSPM